MQFLDLRGHVGEGKRCALGIGRKDRLTLINLAEKIHQVLLNVMVFKQLALSDYR